MLSVGTLSACTELCPYPWGAVAVETGFFSVGEVKGEVEEEELELKEETVAEEGIGSFEFMSMLESVRVLVLEKEKGLVKEEK